MTTYAPGAGTGPIRRESRSKRMEKLPGISSPSVEPGSKFTEPEEFINDDAAAFLALSTLVGNKDERELLLPPSMRTGKPAEYWETPEGKDILNKTVPTALLSSLTDLVIQLTSPETLASLQRQYNNKIRKAFERSTPQVQCRGTIGAVIYGTTQCWICGHTFMDKYPKGTSVELGPECEHIFPIAQALVFTGLFEPQLFKELQDTSKTNTMAEAYLTGVTMEYGWAHRICNQTKRDAHFIEYIEGPISPDNTNAIGRYEANTDKIRKFLTSLSTTPNYGKGNDLLKLIGLPTEKWIESRIPEIQKKCQILIDAATKDSSVGVLVANTVMAMQSYLAYNDVAVLPSKPTVTPGVMGKYTSENAIAVGNYAAQNAVRHVLEFFDTFIESKGRILGPAGFRRDVSAGILLSCQNYIVTNKDTIAALSKTLRDNTAYHIIRTEAPDPWNSIVSKTTQVITATVYTKTANELPAYIAEHITVYHVDEEEKKKTLDIILNPELVKTITDWAESKRSAVLTIIPDLDTIQAYTPEELDSKDWKPDWYVAGGVRRPLYSYPKSLQVHTTRRARRTRKTPQ